MKLTCSTCQARYSIADHKVRGRIVKIRCRSCGAILVAQGADTTEGLDGREDTEPGAPMPTASSAQTGARHEQSVLFSLAALQRTRPPERASAPASESSGLIDLRMLARSLGTGSTENRPPPSDAIAHLGSGVFSPALVPALAAEPDLAGTARNAGSPRRARRPLLMLLTGLAIPMVLTLVAALARVSSVTGTPAPLSEPVQAAVLTPVAAGPAIAASATIVDTASAPIAEAKPPPVGNAHPVPVTRATAAPPPEPAPVASAHPTEPAPAHRCCPGESETTCEMRRAVGAGCGAASPPPASEALAAFDSAAASRAMGAVNLQGCPKAGAQGVSGHARVTFQPSGAVSEVLVDTPQLSGTATERCVAQAYRKVKVAAFSGSALTVGKRFTLQ